MVRDVDSQHAGRLAEPRLEFLEAGRETERWSSIWAETNGASKPRPGTLRARCRRDRAAFLTPFSSGPRAAGRPGGKALKSSADASSTSDVLGDEVVHP